MSEKAVISGQITPKQERFVNEYLDCDFIVQAAYEVGISERTARRWLACQEIQQAIDHVRRARREIRENRLAKCLSLAIDILYDNLECARDDKEAERTHNHIDYDHEFKYVALMLKYAYDQREVEALRARIAQLEAEAQVHEVEGTVTRLPAKRGISRQS